MWLVGLFGIMIYVFTGNGKGKTSAGLGMGLRAAGAGKKVIMVQFLKDGSSSELEAIKEIDNFNVESFGKKGFFVPQSELTDELEQQGVEASTEEDEKLVEQGLDFAQEEVDRCDLLILDEINLALHYGLLKTERILEFVKKAETDLVLTGRYCPDSVIKAADLVTEMKEVKHYYKRGQSAQRGIEL